MKTLALYECLNKCMNEGKGDYFIYVNDHPVVSYDDYSFIGFTLDVDTGKPIPIERIYEDVKSCYDYVTKHNGEEIDLKVSFENNGRIEWREPVSYRIDDKKKAIILELD